MLAVEQLPLSRPQAEKAEAPDKKAKPLPKPNVITARYAQNHGAPFLHLSAMQAREATAEANSESRIGAAIATKCEMNLAGSPLSRPASVSVVAPALRRADRRRYPLRA